MVHADVPQESVLASARGTQKGTRVLEWLASLPVEGSVEFVEVSWDPAAVHGAARDSDIAAVPAIVHVRSRTEFYGIFLFLRTLAQLSSYFSIWGRVRSALLAVTRGHLAEKQGRACAVALSGDCFSKAWGDKA